MSEKTQAGFGKCDTSLTCSDKWSSLEPDNACTFTSRGVFYHNSRDYQRAINDYNQAIELAPDFSVAFYNRGIAYYYLENYQQAVTDYSRAIELNPKYTAAYCNRGLAYYQLDNQYAKSSRFEISLSFWI